MVKKMSVNAASTEVAVMTTKSPAASDVLAGVVTVPEVEPIANVTVTMVEVTPPDTLETVKVDAAVVPAVKHRNEYWEADVERVVARWAT